MKQYLDSLRHVLAHGRERTDRTGTGTISMFGMQERYPLMRGATPVLPVLTTKRVNLRSVIHELLWLLHGDTNIDYLLKHNVHIWDEWADGAGDLGPVYGEQWRAWRTPDGEVIDQIKEALQELKECPDSRRIVVSAWNPAVLPLRGIPPNEQPAHGRMALAPCHTLFQLYTTPLTFAERIDASTATGLSMPTCVAHSSYDRIVEWLDANNVPTLGLSCQLYQRSGDMFLGVPFNIASYALLTHMVAQQVGMMPMELVHTLGDAHIYSNHMEQVRTQLARKPVPPPTLRLHKAANLFAYEESDVEVIGYDPLSYIPAPVAV